MLSPLFAGKYQVKIEKPPEVQEKLQGSTPEQLRHVDFEATYWAERTLSRRHLDDERSCLTLYRDGDRWEMIPDKPQALSIEDDVVILVDDEPIKDITSLLNKGIAGQRPGNDASAFREGMAALDKGLSDQVDALKEKHGASPGEYRFTWNFEDEAEQEPFYAALDAAHDQYRDDKKALFERFTTDLTTVNARVKRVFKLYPEDRDWTVDVDIIHPEKGQLEC